MKPIMSISLLVALACTLPGVRSYSQDHKFEYGVNFGALVYQGDLTPEKLGAFKTRKFGLGLSVARMISPSFSVRGHLLIGKLKADESLYSTPEYRQQRNFNFTSPVFELSASLVYNITRKNYADLGFSPYVFAGAGLSFLGISRDWSRFNTEYFGDPSPSLTGLIEDTAHALPRVIPVIPVGAGFRYFFSPRWGLNAEASYRLSYTDYLDGFSHSVNPELKDHYLNYAVGIIFRPGKKDRLSCPAVKY